MRNTQQKLSGKLKNTPTSTSLACSSGSSELTREETLSVQNKALPDNGLEENQQSGKTGQSLRVFVLNMRGQPLMPTFPRKARKLLEAGRAKVVKRTPFVIQLLRASGESKQEITLGIDSGYIGVGFSATTEERELVSGELTLRKDVSKKVEQKAMYRRNRRSRLWYRQPRFDNRAKSVGWLAPSLQHKLDSHVRLIMMLRGWLPVTKTIVEVASFDTQKMMNPEISGVEYQQGELQGYAIREYLLDKWGRKCVYCEKSGIPLEVEHLIPKARGGSNRVSNLAIACKGCNQKKDQQTAEEFGFPKLQKLANKSLKATAFMNVVRKRLSKQVGAEETFGYVTKHNRIKNHIRKSHVNDAFVIAGGTSQERCKPFTVSRTRRNNRSIQMNRKGYKPSIRRRRYELQPNDLVRFSGCEYRVKGMFSYGTRVRLDEGTNINVNDVELICHGKGLSFT